MDLVGTMTQNWITECGEECGMATILPLWQAGRKEVLDEILEGGIKAVFSCVKTPHFDQTWIGTCPPPEKAPTTHVQARATRCETSGCARSLGSCVSRSVLCDCFGTRANAPPDSCLPLTCHRQIT